MGKIVLVNLPLTKNRKGPYLYTDLHLNLGLNNTINNFLYQNPDINDLELDYDIKAITNSLYNLFTTTPGEKILNPDYGMDFKQFLFMPATVQLAENIRDEIYRQIRTYEPRVKVTDVKITIMEDVNEFDIFIYYNVPTLNISNISIFGTLNNNGFNILT
jgi:phage baseplate assembly protein W